MHSVFNEMLTRYRQRDFAVAKETLARCRAVANGFDLDYLLDIYAERIEDFQKNPPPADWNGAMALETK